MPLARHGGDIFGAARRLGVPVSGIMDFSASINPLGLSPRVSRRLKKELGLVCHYPDPRQAELRSLVASRENIEPNAILFGNGATQLLYLIPRHLKPRKALLAPPTFSEYASAFRYLGCRIRESRLDSERCFRVEPDRLLRTLGAERPDVLILGNPNNPTGASIPSESLAEIIKGCVRRRVHLVVDESFIEFTSRPSLAGLASRQRYLIVLRSLTKFFALPGLRIGYLVAHPTVVEKLSYELEPWSVNTLAAIAATESMRDCAFREKSLALIAGERQYLSKGLVKLGWLHPYPSEANFLLVGIKERGVRGISLRKKLEARRILIRDCTDFRGLGQRYVRIAVRSRKENYALLEALRMIGDTLAGQREALPCLHARS
jgi:threonine-phosphate decarboxylase